MNKKRSYIIIFSLLFILTIGIIFIDYSKQLSAILADAATPNPGHALEEIGGRETLVTTSGDQTIDGNVGIGKSPSVRLDVDGKIKATEIEVTKVISTGSVKIGDSSLDCSSSEEGSVKYNQSTKNLEVCNGSSWISFSQKACQLDGLPQTTSWGDNQYYCMGDNYRCFNGECKMCAGSLIDGKCWYSVSGQQTPCLERGGVDNPYYADPSDCTICSTLVKNTEYWLGQPISCEGSSDYGPMAMSTGPRHYNEIKCYYHNSSSNRESPPGYPPYMPYGGTFWAPCKY